MPSTVTGLTDMSLSNDTGIVRRALDLTHNEHTPVSPSCPGCFGNAALQRILDLLEKADVFSFADGSSVKYDDHNACWRVKLSGGAGLHLDGSFSVGPGVMWQSLDEALEALQKVNYDDSLVLVNGKCKHKDCVCNKSSQRHDLTLDGHDHDGPCVDSLCPGFRRVL